MNKTTWMKRFIVGIILIGSVVSMSGCVLKLFIPAPKRSFIPIDLLLTNEDLPPLWSKVFGPSEAGVYAKPRNSTEIALMKLTNSELKYGKKWDVLEIIYPFDSIEGAKEDYKVTITFPGETNIQGWTFLSSQADEQKFSCYSYSNIDFPQCRWVARYAEIEIEVIAWVDPNRFSLDELQELVKRIDEKIVQNLKP